jgi:polysaccharide export outer membrane protein
MGPRMKNFNATLLYSLLALSFLASSHAQSPAPAVTAVDPLQACEATSAEEYKLGFGDQISVDVNNDDPKLSGKHTVGPDGRITLGLAGSIDVEGATREEAAEKIKAKLALYYTPPPTVVVGVDIYSSDYVMVMGAVDHPGPMMFDEPPTLLSVISRAGMAQQSGTGIVSTASGVPDRVALFCGSYSVAWEDFKQLLENNDPHIRMPLKRNIVVYVPSPHDRYVAIWGEVKSPGLVQLPEHATVTQMLAEAGGIVTDKSGRLPDIQIIHHHEGSIETVAYADILKAKSEHEVALQSGDIIYVPESKYSRFGVTLEKLSPLISIGTVGALIAHP